MANALSGNDTIDFGLSGTIGLTSGELSITDGLTINGLGANLLTVDAQMKNFRVFNIDDASNSNLIDVFINGLTITGGNPSGDGGGIFNLENLTVADSTIIGNTADDGGGISLDIFLIIYPFENTANLTNTIIANSTNGDCVLVNSSIGTNVNNLIEDGSCNP